MRIPGPLVLGLILAFGKPVLAQKAEADAAFQRGKALMAKGQTAEACGEFETSMRLEPLNGTLYNLALCHEQLGKIASAWSEFREVATNDKNAPRAKDSAKRAAALEKKLTRMKIVVTSRADGLTIVRDGLDVTSFVDQEVPVDPARYTFVASAPGHDPATLKIDLTQPGATITVTIPELAVSKTTPGGGTGGNGIGGTGGTGGTGGSSGTGLGGVVLPPLDASSPRLTLRPLALPKGVYEVQLAEQLSDSTNFAVDPIDTVVTGRLGFGRVEGYTEMYFHTRYREQTNKPTLLEYVKLHARYVIHSQLTAGVGYELLHPLGANMSADGTAYRAYVATKKVLTPVVALVGDAGIGFDKQHQGDYTYDEFALLANGIAQFSPIPRLGLEALARLRINLDGQLFKDTLGLEVGGRATGVIAKRTDAYIETRFVVAPSSDVRVVILGITQRLP